MNFDNISFLNTPPIFTDIRFNIWQTRFRTFLQRINNELWEIIVNGLFIHTHQVCDEVVNKSDSIWTEVENRKFENFF